MGILGFLSLPLNTPNVIVQRKKIFSNGPNSKSLKENNGAFIRGKGLLVSLVIKFLRKFSSLVLLELFICVLL